MAVSVQAVVGLLALNFVLEGALSKLVHLDAVPEIPTLLSLAVIVGVLAVTTVTSLRADARTRQPESVGSRTTRGGSA